MVLMIMLRYCFLTRINILKINILFRTFISLDRIMTSLVVDKGTLVGSRRNYSWVKLLQCQQLEEKVEASAGNLLGKIKAKQTKLWKQEPIKQTMDMMQETYRLWAIMTHNRTHTWQLQHAISHNETQVRVISEACDLLGLMGRKLWQ